MQFVRGKIGLAAAALAVSAGAWASSHREAPFITEIPKVDGTDFYMFRSYEQGRQDFTTLIANYLPLQDAYGGPNYFSLDPDALYEIHVDNNGDAVEDLTFQFRFTNNFSNVARIPVPAGSNNLVAVPLINTGGVGPGAADNGNLGVRETYTVTVVRGERRSTGSARTLATNMTAGGNSTVFNKPVDFIGTKTFGSRANYQTYAGNHIFNIGIPGCATPGKVFVGQRAEGFVVNLGEVFDLVNLNPLGARNSRSNIIDDKNITSIALEVPTQCLTNGTEPVIGAWTTASLRQARLLNSRPVGPVKPASGPGQGPAKEGGAWTQVSRLGMPLVNEVVIGLPEKDKFNASEPRSDVANFGNYVLTPTLPELVRILFGVTPPATPRSDLLSVFVTGIRTPVANRNLGMNTDGTTMVDFTHPQGVNLQTLAGAGEMLRMHTGFPGTVTAAAMQNDLGFLGCDLSGFPNGRRPIDDVVDIALTVAEGALTGTNGLQTCDVTVSPPLVRNAGTVVNDGAQPVPADYLTAFPYLNTPHPGAAPVLN